MLNKNMVSFQWLLDVFQRWLQVLCKHLSLQCTFFPTLEWYTVYCIKPWAYLVHFIYSLFKEMAGKYSLLLRIVSPPHSWSTGHTTFQSFLFCFSKSVEQCVFVAFLERIDKSTPATCVIETRKKFLFIS